MQQLHLKSVFRTLRHLKAKIKPILMSLNTFLSCPSCMEYLDNTCLVLSTAFPALFYGIGTFSPFELFSESNRQNRLFLEKLPVLERLSNSRRKSIDRVGKTHSANWPVYKSPARRCLPDHRSLTFPTPTLT